jgi:hypothetical protein
MAQNVTKDDIVWPSPCGHTVLTSLCFHYCLTYIFVIYFFRYALLINDNENLQTLFIDDVEKNLEIRHGNMSFHFNRKLCLHLIRKFEKNVKMAPNAQNDIGNTTNGDQAACMLLRNHFFCSYL